MTNQVEEDYLEQLRKSFNCHVANGLFLKAKKIDAVIRAIERNQDE